MGHEHPGDGPMLGEPFSGADMHFEPVGPHERLDHPRDTVGAGDAELAIRTRAPTHRALTQIATIDEAVGAYA